MYHLYAVCDLVEIMVHLWPVPSKRILADNNTALAWSGEDELTIHTATTTMHAHQDAH